MSAYRNALALEVDARGERRELAADLLRSGRGVVLLAGRLALRPVGDAVICEVITRLADFRRTPEAFDVELQSGRDLLATSTLSDVLEGRRQEWIVVEDDGNSTFQLWPT